MILVVPCRVEAKFIFYMPKLSFGALGSSKVSVLPSLHSKLVANFYEQNVSLAHL